MDSSSECPKQFFSIAIVNGQLTAIGGKRKHKATNNLLCLQQESPDRFKQEWIEKLPSMTYCHNLPAVATTDTSLIVAGEWGPDVKKAPVEVMNVDTLQWSTVASLPHPLWEATATISGDILYIGGGYISSGKATKSVVECEVKHLWPQSRTTKLLGYAGLSVWKEAAPLPVILSSLVTFQGQLLAVGGATSSSVSDSTSDLR